MQYELPRGIETIVLAYPRSGSHYVRFLIEYATNRPTLGCLGNERDVPICHNQFPAPSPLAKVTGTPIAVKSHRAGQVRKWLERTREPKRLLLISRNPLECIANHMDHRWTSQTLVENIDWWKRNYLLYEEFAGEKTLICYERLLSPKTRALEIEKLVGFFDHDSARLRDLLTNIESLSTISKLGTNRAWKGVRSGDDLAYHQRRVAKRLRYTHMVSKRLKTSDAVPQQYKESLRRATIKSIFPRFL